MLEYSFQMFSILISRPSVGISQDVLSKAKQDYEELKQKQNITVEEIEKSMIDFGMQVWPYWQAFEEFEEKYGKEKEKELFESALKEDLRNKWKEYESSLVNKAVIDQGNAFEQSFTPEENHEIQEAVVRAKEKSNEYLSNLAKGEKSDEYNSIVTKCQGELIIIIEKIKDLEELKKTKEKWKEEIDKEIRYFEKGIAQIELDPTVTAIQEKIDFFTSQR